MRERYEGQGLERLFLALWVFAATAQAVLAEREACAKECEELRPSKPEYDQRFYDGCTLSAAEIRQRHVQQDPQSKN